MRLNISPLIIIFIISLINGCFYSFYLTNTVFADASQFELLGRNILDGHFSLSKEYPYLPSMHREPLYPFFLSIIYKIFGYNNLFVYFFQIIIFYLITLLTYVVAKNIFDKKVAILSSFIVSLLPTLANYTGFILSELFFTFILIILIYLLIIAFQTKKNYFFLLVGFFLAFSTLVKSYMLLFLIIIIFTMFFNYKNLKNGFINKLLLLILGFSIITGSWSYRNYNHFETFQLTLRGGTSLWMAADLTDASKSDIFKNIIFNFSEYLGAKIYSENILHPQKVILARVNKFHDRIELLKNSGLSDEEAENRIANEAILKILKNPITYILQRFLELQKQISFLYIPSLNQFNIDLYLNKNITQNIYFSKYNNGALILSIIKFPFKMLSYLFFTLTIYAIIRKRNEMHKIFFPTIIIIYTNLIYSLLFGLGRYGVPLIPFYVIFSSWSIINLYNYFILKKINKF